MDKHAAKESAGSRVRGARVARLLETLAATAFIVIGLTAPATGWSSLSSAGVTERVSVGSSGEEANQASGAAVVSQDGRFVAFSSQAWNLVPGDTNGVSDAFVHDRQTGATERVNLDSFGRQAESFGSGPCGISADGRYVAFVSLASNLVPGDTNNTYDVFVRDRQSGTTERVSVDSFGGETPPGHASFGGVSCLSADGRFVAFQSDASNLVPGDTNGFMDIFVHDRQTGTTERVSVDSSGGQANYVSETSAISANGRVVAFESAASNLVPGDTNGYDDVFVHDRQTGATGRVDVSSFGEQANRGTANFPAISSDGRFVAFMSDSSNLVPGDANGSSDVFVHDRQTGATELVSVDSYGAQSSGHRGWPAISGDGRFVAFESRSKKLVPDDSNRASDIFVHDRQTGATTRASIDSSGGQANRLSQYAALSADGRLVAFTSGATNLVPADTNGVDDVFVHLRNPPTIDSFAPASGITGSKVTIVGANFDTATQVSFDGARARFTVVSPTQLVAKVPDGATSSKIRVVNLDGASDSSTDYTVTFSITDLSPTSGPVGTLVTLTGVGFSDVTSVKFHRVSAPFSILSPTSIQTTVPTGATTGTVTARSPQGTVTGPKFTVTP